MAASYSDPDCNGRGRCLAIVVHFPENSAFASWDLKWTRFVPRAFSSQFLMRQLLT